MLYSYARLDAEQLQQLQTLEQEIGQTLVAFKGVDADLPELSAAELVRIRETEERLGLALVAVH